MSDKTFRAELTAPLLLVACSLWFLTGLYQYLNGGSWLFMTLPLFGIAGAWRRARRRRREEPVPDISRELSMEDLWPGVLVAVALVLWLGLLVARAFKPMGSAATGSRPAHGYRLPRAGRWWTHGLRPSPTPAPR